MKVSNHGNYFSFADAIDKSIFIELFKYNFFLGIFRYIFFLYYGTENPSYPAFAILCAVKQGGVRIR